MDVTLPLNLPKRSATLLTRKEKKMDEEKPSENKVPSGVPSDKTLKRAVFYDFTHPDTAIAAHEILRHERGYQQLRMQGRYTDWRPTDDHVLRIAKEVKRLIAENERLRTSLRSVKKFFTDLEDGTDNEDPLRKIREQFHAHVVIDAALEDQRNG